MKQILMVKPFLNKSNNQISFNLPRRQINIPKNKFPSLIQIQITGIKMSKS